MKIGILSDSHDNLPALVKAVSVFNDAGVSHVLHAGDLVAPFTAKPLKKLNMGFTAVFGNNDGEILGLYHVFKDQIFRAPHVVHLNHKKILLLHEGDNLEALAISGKFDAIIYGHTHEVDIRKDPTLVINPGECGGWLSGRRTVAIWDMEKGQVNTVVL
ncbi:metallophosphoesterase [bacterium]|nr:metallophosphoesterase [bacterium]